MQTKTKQSFQQPHQDSNYELTMPLSQTTEERHEWLSDHFNRLPYKIYQIWLILTLPLVIIVEMGVIAAICYAIKADGDLRHLTIRLEFVPFGIGFMFLFYGSTEMLFALKNKQPRIAQQGFLRFQYGLISATVNLLFILKNSQIEIDYRLYHNEDWQFLVALTVISIIHLIGGLCVLRIFKKYQILASQVLKEEEQRDFVEQNEAIASEIEKYNGKLNTWPYLLYKFWLKFVVVFEITRVCEYIVAKLMDTRQNTTNLVEFIGFTGLSILSFLSAISCFGVDVAIRTKTLVKLNQAIPFLKICAVLSIILYVLAAQELTMNEGISKPGEFFSYVFWFFYCLIVPVLTLSGALNAKKILELRDQFVKASSYNDEVYL